MGERKDGSAVECVDLTKIYPGGTTALDRLTLSIPAGASFGLLGENGAGKSTLVHLLLGLIFPTAGTVRVLGEREPARAHPRVGYVHERPAFEMRMSAAGYLTYLAQLAGLWGAACGARVRAVLAEVGLEAVATRRTGTFSKGMLQRLAIAQALLTDPDLLILDEPSSGLDPGGQYEVRQIIAALRQQGKTLLLCSHYLPEVEGLCDMVGILRRGRLVQHGSVTELLRVEDTVEVVLADDQPAGQVVERLGLGPLALEVHEHAIRVRAAAQAEVLAALVRAGVSLHSLSPVTQTLEDVYVRATRQAPTRMPAAAAGRQGVGEAANTAGTAEGAR